MESGESSLMERTGWWLRRSTEVFELQPAPHARFAGCFALSTGAATPPGQEGRWFPPPGIFTPTWLQWIRFQQTNGGAHLLQLFHRIKHDHMPPGLRNQIHKEKVLER